MPDPSLCSQKSCHLSEKAPTFKKIIIISKIVPSKNNATLISIE